MFIILIYRYHRGQPVFVEGRQMPKFPAVISAIGNETVSSFFSILNDLKLWLH